MSDLSPNIILLLGPSGIGKTTITKAVLQKVKGINFVVLDNLAHKMARESGLIDKRDDLTALIKALEYDRQRFFEYGLMALENHIADTKGKVLVDVGTGFLDAPHSINWVRSKPSICLFAEPQAAFLRFKKARKLDVSYEQFMTTQYCKPRINVYKSADIVLKTDDLTEQQACQRFFSAYTSLLNDTDFFALNAQWRQHKRLA